jgi:spermidine/putrescine transport system substrate-binding protein
VRTRRDFLASAAALLAGAGCVGRGSSSAQTFPPDILGTPEQRAESTMTLLGQPGELPMQALSDFHVRTGVKVTTETVGSDDTLMLRLAAGGYGQFDCVIVGSDSLASLVELQQVEPLAKKLVPNMSALHPPLDDSPADSGLRHSVPSSYDIVGVAIKPSALIESDSWTSLFALAERHPGRVVVPDNADEVIGAVLVSLGHAWDSDSTGDLDDAAARLDQLFPTLRVLGRRPTGHSRIVSRPPIAYMAHSRAFRKERADLRFFVPSEGSALDVRSYCIPIYAPHPVAAHAWLNEWLQPSIEAGAVAELLLPVPLEQARPLIRPELAANQALCPPLPVLANSIQPSISADGQDRRDQIWTDLTG